MDEDDFDYGERLRTRCTDALAEEFRGVFSRETVARYVDESDALLAAWQPGRETSFFPPRLDRFASERLHALAQAERLTPKTRPEALFVCVHNAGRSQMAAALTHHLSDGRVHVRSAGSQPELSIHPAVVEAMSEIGVDVTHEFPKPLTDEVVRAADVVVTMGCGDSCPVYPGKRYADWDVADPAGQPIDVVRAIRDDVRRRVEALLEELIGAPAT